jgi:signal peptidase II
MDVGTQLGGTWGSQAEGEEDPMNRAKRTFLLILVLASCIGCDRVTKVIAREHLAASPAISYLNDLFRLQYAENHGAFLGLGAGLPDGLRVAILTVLVGTMLMGLLVYTMASRQLRLDCSLALALIVGGGLSNLLDRLLYHGAVVDFMNIGVGSLRTGVFNVADVAIMIGAGLLGLSLLRQDTAKAATSP